jgi:hypothetical protein
MTFTLSRLVASKSQEQIRKVHRELTPIAVRPLDALSLTQRTKLVLAKLLLKLGVESGLPSSTWQAFCKLIVSHLPFRFLCFLLAFGSGMYGFQASVSAIFL